jgi:hypothetical protein
LHYDTFESDVRRRQADYRAIAARSSLVREARRSRRDAGRPLSLSLKAARLLHAAADRLEASAEA